VVLIALSPDPLKRFNSVQDFATALEQAATGAFFDPGLIARTAEPALSVSTEDIELAQVVRKTDHRHSEALFTSADVPLMSKSMQKQTAELLPRVTRALEEEQEADDEVVQAADDEKHDAVPEHDDAPEQDIPEQEEEHVYDVPVAAVRAVSAERRSAPQPYVVVDNGQSKRAPSFLTGVIFVLLILIIISGIFAALHLFM
jgi:hypothetical protein